MPQIHAERRRFGSGRGKSKPERDLHHFLPFYILWSYFGSSSANLVTCANDDLQSEIPSLKYLKAPVGEQQTILIPHPQQKALLLPAKFGDFVVETIDVPKPGPGDVLIKIYTTALNPMDWKIQKFGIFYERFPAILGTDIAGEIEELGEGVSSLKKGDKVFCQGTFDNEGASFQQYAIATANTLSKVVNHLLPLSNLGSQPQQIPENYSYDDVSTIPVTLTCSWVGLYNKPPYGLGFEPPVTPSAFGKYAGTPLVIFNGAGSVGQFVIQLAKANGFSPIITTASLKHTEYLKTLGATNIIDRNIPSSELGAEIKKITSKPITAVYDAVASPEMQQAGLNILAPGGAIATILPPDPNLKKEDGKAVQHVTGILKLPHNQALLKDMYSVLTKLLEDGHLKPNPLEVLPNGLAGIPGGLDRLEKNLVSGIKLVVHPFETP
ncbi:hypothetical protein BDQ17DRAFT_1547847 [Cyathus striatus]|nr:hypothetical protein BDQ17DRAFT_1547847 [Cyathus striatus]